MKIKDLTNYLYGLFPLKDVIMEDFAGKQFGRDNLEIKNVLLCLDLEKDSLDFAIKNNVNLIITHHPFFFGNKKNLIEKFKHKKEIYNTARKYNITVHSFHTNFDNNKDGMNPAILNRLDFKKVEYSKAMPCLAIGHYDKEIDIKIFIEKFKKEFNFNKLTLLNYGKKSIKKIGLIAGGASDFVFEAYKQGIDLYISGDVSHHTRREVIQEKLNYLDVPHEIENQFIYQMKDIISKKFVDINLLTFEEKILP